MSTNNLKSGGVSSDTPVDPVQFVRGVAASVVGEKDTIFIKTIFMDMLDDNFHASAILNQIVFWTGVGLTYEQDGHKWLYKNHSDWYQECRVKERNARAVIKRLENEGLIFTQPGRIGKGFNAKNVVLIRINPDGFAKAYQDAITSHQPHDIKCQIDMTPNVRHKDIDSLAENSKDNTISPNGEIPVPAGTGLVDEPVEEIFVSQTCQELPFEAYPAVQGKSKTHIITNEDIAFGRFTRRAGEKLCRTSGAGEEPSRLELVDEEPTCQNCLARAKQILEEGDRIGIRDALVVVFEWGIKGQNQDLKLTGSVYGQIQNAISKILEMTPDVTPSQIERAFVWYTLIADWNREARMLFNPEGLANGNWRNFLDHEKSYPNWFEKFEQELPKWREFFFAQRVHLRLVMRDKIIPRINPNLQSWQVSQSAMDTHQPVRKPTLEERRAIADQMAKEIEGEEKSRRLGGVR